MTAELSLPDTLCLPRSGKSEVLCEGGEGDRNVGRGCVHTNRNAGWKDPDVWQSQTVWYLQMVHVRHTLHGRNPATS